MFSKPYLKPETVAAQRTKRYWLGQAEKTTQLSKSAKNFNHLLFGNKSNDFHHFLTAAQGQAQAAAEPGLDAGHKTQIDNLLAVGAEKQNLFRVFRLGVFYGVARR